jgi:hypothetical protein
VSRSTKPSTTRHRERTSVPLVQVRVAYRHAFTQRDLVGPKAIDLL